MSASTPRTVSEQAASVAVPGNIKKVAAPLWPFPVSCNRGIEGHEGRGTVFAESAFSEAFLQNHVVNYKNVLIRCHKKKVILHQTISRPPKPALITPCTIFYNSNYHLANI